MKTIRRWGGFRERNDVAQAVNPDGLTVRRGSHRLTFLALAAVLVGLGLAALALGPVAISPDRVIATLFGAGDGVESAIILQIRLPRLLLGIAVGTALALAGASLQGVLRNPLADPGLIGVSAGATVGAVLVIVVGERFGAGLPDALRPWLLPGAAFLGAGVVIAFVFALARRGGETSVATLILAGVAVNTVAGAIVGVMVYISDDQQLRDLTFWTLGALSASSLQTTLIASAIALLTVPAFIRGTRALDLFQLGERAAFHSGLNVERAKVVVALATAVSVGAVTAAAGPIGFIGLVAPHLARMIVGPSHAFILPTAVMLGVALILAADLAVRLAVPPAEPPIGLATSIIGGPFFLWLLIRNRGRLHA
ncbi:MAG: iron ABC transporter permease [Pseudomonadota bacterium]